MPISEHLNSSQFPDFPYPRLRENFATMWSVNMADLFKEDDPLVDPRELLESGEYQAKAFTELALKDPTDTMTREHLIDVGFKQRKKAQMIRSSWYN